METWYATSSGGDDWYRLIEAGTLRRGLLAAALTLLAGGCYSAQCEKMGYASGTPENARCVYAMQKQTNDALNNLSQQLRSMSEQLNKSAQQKKGTPQTQSYGGQAYSGGVTSLYDTPGAAALRGQRY